MIALKAYQGAYSKRNSHFKGDACVHAYAHACVCHTHALVYR